MRDTLNEAFLGPAGLARVASLVESGRSPFGHHVSVATVRDLIRGCGATDGSKDVALAHLEATAFLDGASTVESVLLGIAMGRLPDDVPLADQVTMLHVLRSLDRLPFVVPGDPSTLAP